jgi:TolA-binding protein
MITDARLIEFEKYISSGWVGNHSTDIIAELIAEAREQQRRIRELEQQAELRDEQDSQALREREERIQELEAQPAKKVIIWQSIECPKCGKSIGTLPAEIWEFISDGDRFQCEKCHTKLAIHITPPED